MGGEKMKSLQHYLNQVDDLLDELIQTAQELCNLSNQVAAEEEVIELQKKQGDLIRQLEEADHHIQSFDGSDISEVIHQKLHQKVQKFEMLNQEFIQNFSSTHGLIQFELKRPKEREERSLRFKFKPKASGEKFS